MKKNLLALVLLFAITGAASAQEVGAGHYYIGGSFDYNYDQAGTTTSYTYTTGSTLYTNEHITDIQVSPDFGFFFIK